MAIPNDDNSNPRAGMILAGWVFLSLMLQILLWASGARPTSLIVAVNRGAERVEARGVGEESDDVVRKAILLQQETLPFWTVLVAIGDGVLEPLQLVVRATLVATLFSGLAALRGRPTIFARSFREGAWSQGFWVLGLAVRTAMVVTLGRADVETSATLLLPAGMYDVVVWVALEQLSVFALIGWFALARGGVCRGQAGWLMAVTICGTLWIVEAMIGVAATLIVGAGMRSTLIPDFTS